MAGSVLRFHAPMLRAISDALRLEPVSQIARQPGTKAVYRITVNYYDGRASNSVATLHCAAERIELQVAYQRAFSAKPLTYRIDELRYETFVRALQSLRFDRMTDQPDLPEYNAADLWLVERAAGTFVHSVIVAPTLARDDHGRLVNAVRHGLPEALRQF
jgi:hypothetical protein